ncbi:carbon-nitrogen hydrolase family protein [Mycolicibacterium sp. HK-90]|uniref:carbon-nitrogen hydrolase family protein n=1 Tax=Mycolicibacterium sp. HK-90 TaxID=3056937 RepID=UPI00265A3C0D|nr:nitrilase-related carbon-nitrogen hydrolase [Mycolicibacterium sp. HK-90]WKG03130.1 nitrilase-related carbon-nitrogen hydrolase [Mycolicibacterium sp. HK-90]
MIETIRDLLTTARATVDTGSTMTSPKTLRLTVIQEAPRSRDLERNISRVSGAIAARDRSDLVVFPELFLSGYQTTALDEIALTLDDPRITGLSDCCRSAGTALLAGFVEQGPGGYFDAYLAIDRDGTIRSSIRKTHLFGTEREAFLSGEVIEPVSLCDTKIGVLNCFELEFPEVARTLVLRGAALLVAGSANMHPYERDHLIASSSRVLENRVPLAYANRVGSESGHSFCGSSRIIDRDGSVVAALNSVETGVVTVDLEVGLRSEGVVDMLGQRRPELYES